MTGHQRTHASAADFRTNVLCVRNTPRRRVQAAVVLFCIFRGLAGNSVDVLSDHQEKEPPNRSAAAVVAKSSHIHSVSFIPSTHSLVGWLARSLFLFLFGSLYLRLTIASPFFPLRSVIVQFAQCLSSTQSIAVTEWSGGRRRPRHPRRCRSFCSSHRRRSIRSLCSFILLPGSQPQYISALVYVCVCVCVCT